jgi:hypothetical protein
MKQNERRFYRLRKTGLRRTDLLFLGVLRIRGNILLRLARCFGAFSAARLAAAREDREFVLVC